jgi:hypothetical protein
MSEEDVTKTTSYFNALRDVADAARKVEEARVRYEDTVDGLLREKREAEKALRAALERAAELTGKYLPSSERDQEAAQRTRISPPFGAKMREEMTVKGYDCDRLKRCRKGLCDRPGRSISQPIARRRTR